MKLDSDGLDGVLHVCRPPVKSRPVAPPISTTAASSKASSTPSRKGHIRPMGQIQPVRPNLERAVPLVSKTPLLNMKTQHLKSGSTTSVFKKPRSSMPSMSSRPRSSTPIPPSKYIKRAATPIPPPIPSPTGRMDNEIQLSTTQTLLAAAPLEKKEVFVSANANMHNHQSGSPKVISALSASTTPIPASVDQTSVNRDTPFDAINTMTPIPMQRSLRLESNQQGPRRRYISVLAAAIVLLALSTVFLFIGIFKYRKSDSRIDLLKALEPFSNITASVAPDRNELSREEKAVASMEPTSSFALTRDAKLSLAGQNLDETQAQMDAALTLGNAYRVPGTYGKDDIHANSMHWGEFDRILRKVRKCKGTIVITGHTCNLGNNETNLFISKRRAEIVARYFMKRGVGKQRLMVQGMGASIPIRDNATKEGRVQNRRVEISCR